MRKIHGIPLLLIAILAVAGIAVANFTGIFTVKPRVFNPVSEQVTMRCDVAAGRNFIKGVMLDLALPRPYDLTYTLRGDENDILENELAIIALDLDNDGYIDPGEPRENIALNESVTFKNINGVYGQVNQNIEVRGYARDNVVVVIPYVEGRDDLSVRKYSVVPTLYVVLAPTIP